MRSNIDLPGRQQELIDAVKATGKPFTVVLFNGRPLTLTKVDASRRAILEAWFPGVEAGNAVADVLFGQVDPGGKLPVSFPRSVGQVPIYYNHEPTGRPCDIDVEVQLALPRHRRCEPLYPFGYGLSYTTFSVTNLRLSKQTVSKSGTVTALSTSPTPAPAWAMTSSSSTCMTRWRASRNRCVACAASSGSRSARPETDRQLHPRQERLRLLRQQRRTSWSSPARSTSTPVTAPPPTLDAVLHSGRLTIRV